MHLPRSVARSVVGVVWPLLAGCSAAHEAPSTAPGAAPPDAAEAAEASPPAPEAGPGPSAIANAYAALTAGRTDQVPALIDALDALVAAEPNDPQALFYSGAMRLWLLGDGLGPTMDLSQMFDTSSTAVARLDQAHALAPDDDLALGFDGLANALVGHRLGNSNMVSAGLAERDQGIARLPAYTHFLRALAAADEQDYGTAVSHMFQTLAACGVPPDAGPTFTYAAGPQDAQHAACNDEGVVPHVFEGFCITFGDFLLRSGAGAEAARAAYRSAQTSPTYAQWPFAPELEARIAQADERAAAYADGGAGDAGDGGPALWPSSGHVCTGCHQQHP